MVSIQKDSENHREFYNSLKESDGGVKYTGMRIGGKHNWNYRSGTWKETKISPNQWKFEFISLKHRFREAPSGTGALNNTKYHWYILADQKVEKIDANTYQTIMKGRKFKVAHKRPNWQMWNYEYNNINYEDIIIDILEDTIRKLQERKSILSR